jgi:hypothetical protein
LIIDIGTNDICDPEKKVKNVAEAIFQLACVTESAGIFKKLRWR